MRMGVGYDVHHLVEGRPLILGGVTIPHDKGLDGHSDADVLTHAIVDALLGAAALGDMGTHFPASDAQYKDVYSLSLLTRVKGLLREHGWRLSPPLEYLLGLDAGAPIGRWPWRPIPRSCPRRRRLSMRLTPFVFETV